MTGNFVYKQSAALVLFAGLSLLISGCGQLIKDDDKAQLAKHVECSNAEADIVVLEK